MALKKTTDTEETAEKKTAVKKTAAKKSTAAEKAAPKKSAAAKKSTDAEKSTARKGILTKKSADEKEPAAKKTAKKASTRKSEPKVSVVIEYAGKQLDTDDVIASVRAAYMKENPDSAIETVEIYIQPEKNVAYYVVNGESGKNTKVKI